MNIEEFRSYCLKLKGATESMPFDNNTLVFKVMNKIFVLTSLDKWELDEGAINVKCEPAKAIRLREEYSFILPGFHMNKKHWNTVVLNDTMPDSFYKGLIRDSYNLIINQLSKKSQKELENL